MVSPPPLETSLIGLLCYYNHGSIITLNDCIPAFQTVTQYGNYLDGTIRVWSGTNIGAASSREGDAENSATAKGDNKFDVHVRARADGWILAYMLRADDHGLVPWFGQLADYGATTNPTAYSTRLSRAIYLVLYAAGISGSFSHETSVGYYDYENPSAAKMFIFGKVWNTAGSDNENHSYVYHTVPGGMTVYRANLAWTLSFQSNAYHYIRVLYDTTQLVEYQMGGGNYWWRYVRTANVLVYMSTGVQHYVDSAVLSMSPNYNYSYSINLRHALVVETS